MKCLKLKVHSLTEDYAKMTIILDNGHIFHVIMSGSWRSITPKIKWTLADTGKSMNKEYEKLSNKEFKKGKKFFEEEN